MLRGIEHAQIIGIFLKLLTFAYNPLYHLQMISGIINARCESLEGVAKKVEAASRRS
jgi:hypothetical protein